MVVSDIENSSMKTFIMNLDQNLKPKSNRMSIYDAIKQKKNLYVEGNTKTFARRLSRFIEL
jgi:hypothetical protein